jgi:Protein of unknown function (DUF1826)
MMVAIPSTVRPRSSGGGDSIAESTDPDILASIAHASTDLALWRRTLPALLVDWLECEKPERLPDDRKLIRLDHLEAALKIMVRPSGATRLPRALLVADVANLTERFAAIANTDIVDIRLEVIRHDACWRFHRDVTPLRLLTTYRGPSTQLPPPDQADHALREQRNYRGPLTEFPRHAVALFKGDPDDSGQGVLHRSPPIAGKRTPRLLLCLNLPSRASPELWTP